MKVKEVNRKTSRPIESDFFYLTVAPLESRAVFYVFALKKSCFS